MCRGGWSGGKRVGIGGRGMRRMVGLRDGGLDV